MIIREDTTLAESGGAGASRALAEAAETYLRGKSRVAAAIKAAPLKKALRAPSSVAVFRGGEPLPWSVEAVAA